MYATEQLVALANTLRGDDARDACEHLARRAEHASPRVARKALKLIARCCDGARDGTFTREMSKLSTRIRALQSRVGAPHPSKGDSEHAAVRAAAREAMGAIFGGAKDAASSVSGGMTSGKIEGFGDGSTVGARAMGRAEERARDDSARPADETTPAREPRLGRLDAPLEASMRSTPKLNLDASGSGVKWKPLRPPSPEKTRSDATTTARATTVEDSLADFTSTSAPSTSPEPMTTSVSKTTHSRDPSVEFTLEGSEEKAAVDKLCTPSGVRLSPVESDVVDFLRTGAHLNAQGVVIALSERLVAYAGGDAAWRSAYRAACVLERAAACEKRWLADVFLHSSAMDLLDAMANDVNAHAQLRDKARSVADALRRRFPSPARASVVPEPSARPPADDVFAQLSDLSVRAPPAPRVDAGLATLRARPPEAASNRLASAPPFDRIDDLLK